MPKRACNVLLFLVLTIEDDLCFEKRWRTPWHMLSDLMTYPVPGLRIWLLDAVVFVLLFFAYGRKRARQGRASPLDGALWLSLASVVLWAVYGLMRGGSAIDMRLQLHIQVMTIVVAFLFLAVYRTSEDFLHAGKIVLYAALFRFAMALAFYVWFVRGQGVNVETVLDHGDTILFVTVITMMIAHALHTHTRRVVTRAVVMVPIMIWCLIINNRRLAWTGLFGALVVLYALASIGWARKRLRRAISTALPLLVIYVAVGWGRTERIFKPLAAFQSIGPDSKDASTRSRDIENLGLVHTLESAPLLGTGFGHEYYEVSSVLAPKDVFPQYKYVPHNSVLGLAAFMGGIGFLGVWLFFPVTAFFGTRAYRFATTPAEKTIAACATAEVFIHLNQMYGDIGVNATQGMVLMPLAIAAASRLSVATGAWGPTSARSA